MLRATFDPASAVASFRGVAASAPRRLAKDLACNSTSRWGVGRDSGDDERVLTAVVRLSFQDVTESDSPPSESAWVRQSIIYGSLK